MARNTIPLEVLRIDAPCPAEWSAMAGDDAKRFCQGCRKHVHNLSAMTRDEAETLVCASAGSMCVRMEVGPDGRVATIDYRPPSLDKRGRGWRFWTGFGLACGLLTLFAQAWAGEKARGTGGAQRGIITGLMVMPSTQQSVMGKIGPPPTSTNPATAPAQQPPLRQGDPT